MASLLAQITMGSQKRNYTTSGESGLEFGPSENKMNNDNKNNDNEIIVENPFRPSGRIQRSPNRSALTPQRTYTAEKEDDEMHLTRLRMEEELAFVSLGNKLSTMNSIVTDARNIHKTIRDNLAQAVALYQQLRENREAIAICNIFGKSQKKAVVSTSDKEAQTERDNSKRAASLSPEEDRSKKKVRTSQNVENNAHTENNPNMVVEANTENGKPWSIVESQRKKKNNKRNSNRNPVRIKGEVITIKADNSSYADILKQMKTVINPEEIGINIKKIRKTKEGHVLVEMMKGDGQARKLQTAIKGSLGDKMQVETMVEKFLIDIRDMEESTEAEEVIQGILQATGEEDASKFTVQNIRESYGGSKQALVEVPANIAATILQKNSIRIGLVICRVRRKFFVKRCFRCMEPGHLARSCQGKDRSQACIRCGIDGHKARECKNDPRCIICLEAGRQNIRHYIGSAAACSYKNES